MKGSLGFLHLLAVVNNAVKYMGVDILPNVLSSIWLDVFSLLDRVGYFLIHFATFAI